MCRGEGWIRGRTGVGSGEAVVDLWREYLSGSWSLFIFGYN